MRQRRYSRAVRLKMLKLYKSGIRSTRRIAYLVGCSHMAVYRELGGLYRKYLLRKFRYKRTAYDRFIDSWAK